MQWPPLQLSYRRALVPCGHSKRQSRSCWGPAQGGAIPGQMLLVGSPGGVALASPWGTLLTSSPALPLCWLRGSSLTFPASPCVGFSQSPKKTKTPPLSNSEKPGKSPSSRSLCGGH